MYYIDIIIPTCLTPDRIYDLTCEIKRTSGIFSRVIPTCGTGSPAVNRNIGLDNTDGQILIMLDDDVTNLPMNFARNMVDTLLSNPNHAVVSAKLMDASGRMNMGGWFLDGTTGIGISSAGWAPSACIAFRRTSVRFDETLPCFEDVDYCRQLTRLNPESLFVVNYEVPVLHRNEEKWRSLEAEATANKRLMEKWGELP